MPHPPLTNHGLISDIFIVYPSMRCNTMPTIYFPCAAQAAAQAPPAAAAWSSSSSTTNAAAARTPLEATDFGTRKNRRRAVRLRTWKEGSLRQRAWRVTVGLR